MRLAVIDLGTNTCNLLIADLKDGQYKILYQGKEGVKLGKDGINNKLLTQEAFERATIAFNKHNRIILEYKADKIIVIATSAVRDAANKKEFAAHLLKETGLKLTIISGDQEANLIFKGVKLAFGSLTDNTLIMDIGGGSNEFILAESNEISWQESFPLGIARVLDQFTISDPIEEHEIEQIERYFNKGLSKLWNQLEGIQPEKLVGCSGAFDTLVDLIDQTPPGTKNRVKQDVSIQDFNSISEIIIESTLEERKEMTGMDPLRIEMIVPAFIFIRLIINRLKVNQITQTDFALREGILYEWINN